MIQNKLIEKAQWRDISLGITANMSGEKVQSSGAKSKMAEAVDKCIDMEAEIDRLVDRLIEVKKDVVATIEQVESPTEYDVLHKRYIQKMELEDIAEAYGKEYGWATTTNGRALKSVQEILDSRCAE
mgnify:CR=1 FL=1